MMLALPALGCGNSESHTGSSNRPEFPTGFAGTTSAGGSAATGGSTAAGGSAAMMQADDGVDCTLDKCDDKGCTHVPRHFMCNNHQLCTAGGCRETPCLFDFECETSDSCALGGVCTQGIDGGLCFYRPVDADGDGAYPVACGGNDCNDNDSSTTGPAAEVCDGKDNDCDGVVDPPTASGCEGNLHCVDAKCQCASPFGLCGTPATCLDLSHDTKNCGACGVVCAAGLGCTDGKCDCPEGQDHCGAACVDLQSDAENCGKCGVSCGAAECRDAACSCAAGRTDCDAGAAFDCRALATDATSCGACGKQCSSASSCVASQCDAEVEQVRLYGGADAVAFSAPLVVGSSGNFYTSVFASGEHRALPDGQSPLWSSDLALVKLTQDGSFVWAVPTSERIADLATAGDDVWVALFSGAAIQFGSSKYELAQGHLGLGMLLKVSGVDGAVLESQRFDFLTSVQGMSAKLLVDSDGVWVTFAGGTVDYLGTTSTPPDSYSALFRSGTAVPAWVPGDALNLAFDDDGKIVLGDLTPPGSFSFGGDALNCTIRFGCTAWARYSKQLTYDAAFLSADGDGAAVLPLNGDALFVRTSGTYFKLYDTTGKLLSSRGEFPYEAVELSQNGSKIASYGSTYEAEIQLAGRSFAKHQSFFVIIDAATGLVENGFSMSSGYANGMHTGIDGFAVDWTKGTVLVSYLFDGTFTLGGKSYGQDGVRGVAFIKLKLAQP